jgi:acetoin utilization protein AcuC
MKNAVFIYSKQFLNYKFSRNHPFNQTRIELTKDLLEATEALQASDIVSPRFATDNEIALIHAHDYIEAVKKAGNNDLPEEIALNYGLGTEDTPMFTNMHRASAHIVGGTLTAVDYVMEGRAKHGLSLGGGLHHGLQGKASGFCIYNDSSVAIKYMLEKYNARVLYIDTDAHHGDGVQWSFYDEPNVCTLSIHETGRYLFPGTGHVDERGQGKGYGFSFNVPLDAFTEDDSWIECYSTALREVADFFKPDVILTQNGVDAHYFDPLSHLSATMKLYREIPKVAHEIAHQYCDGRWIAVGGGGYDIWRVVPRAWSLLWLEMTEQQQLAQGPLPEKWRTKWARHTDMELPNSWDDPKGLYPAIPRKQEIEEKNRITLQKTLYPIRKDN